MSCHHVVVPFAHTGVTWAMSARIKGFVADPFGIQRLDALVLA